MLKWFIVLALIALLAWFGYPHVKDAIDTAPKPTAIPL